MKVKLNGTEIMYTATSTDDSVCAQASEPKKLKITFHTLRHWKGTMEYNRTKDIFYVKQILGHKRIENTLIYVQLAEELFKDRIDYVSKVARRKAKPVR